MNEAVSSGTKNRELEALHEDAFRRALDEPSLTLSQAGVLLGDGPRGVWPSTACYRLCIAAKGGSLETVENANWIEFHDEGGNGTLRRERERYEFLHVTRAAFAAWLKTHGNEDDRTSRAARWAQTAMEVAK